MPKPQSEAGERGWLIGKSSRGSVAKGLMRPDRLTVMHRNRPAIFKGRHFEAEIIVLCVRLYLRFALSFSGSGRDHFGAEFGGRPRHDLALGTALRAGTHPTLSPGYSQDEWVVACGRDLRSSGGQVDLFISSGGFDRCHD